MAEFLQVICPLADPRSHGSDGPAFHVVAPSLPGFGFSPFPEPADDRPWSVERVARTWAELMRRLGYERYGAHGNDAGALVSPQLAVVDPEHVIGVHITGGLGIPTGDPAELEGLTEQEHAELGGLMQGWAGASGYAPYLAARPQTLAYGWHDSPVAQLAYLLERFREFDGWPAGEDVPAGSVGRDQLLTTATLYWLTETGASSSWTYYDEAAGLPTHQTAVPTGVSHGGPSAFRKLAERGNDIVHWSASRAPGTWSPWRCRTRWWATSARSSPPRLSGGYRRRDSATPTRQIAPPTNASTGGTSDSRAADIAIVIGGTR